MTAVDWRAAAKPLAKVDRRFTPIIGRHGLPDRRRKSPTPEWQRSATAPWRPLRTLGSWYLWRLLENPS